MPPPMSKMISRSVMPIGTSIRPVLTMRAGQREHLGALALLGADGGEPLAPVAQDGRMLAKVSTLLISVGQPHRPDSAG
jgi:hypothetical protein